MKCKHSPVCSTYWKKKPTQNMYVTAQMLNLHSSNYKPEPLINMKNISNHFHVTD